jgi:hypothetical protein
MLLLMPTSVVLGTSKLLAIVAFTLRHRRRHLRHTLRHPALANLPDHQRTASSSRRLVASAPDYNPEAELTSPAPGAQL